MLNITVQVGISRFRGLDAKKKRAFFMQSSYEICMWGKTLLHALQTKTPSE